MSDRDSNQNRGAEVVAFEWFAQAHPHEAAALDWAKFTTYVRTINPDLSDADIRATLQDTEAEDTPPEERR